MKPEIRNNLAYLPNGRILPWNDATRAWLRRLDEAWYKSPSEYLAELIEASTGFTADFNSTDQECEAPENYS